MSDRFERALDRACTRITSDDCPPTLRRAVRYALFPPGHRFRPRLCYAVAEAAGMPQPDFTDAAAVALEFVHTASLIQDDLACFDDAEERRDRPTVARAFGESAAILASDGLIAGAFEVMAAAQGSPWSTVELTHIVSRAIGSAAGAVAGQAWEVEPMLNISRYHRAKTASLFEAAAMAGAVSAGAEAEEWRACGRHLGMAYQMADDIQDAGEILVGRPNAMASVSAAEAVSRCRKHLAEALAAIPIDADASGIARLVERFSRAFGADEANAEPGPGRRLEALAG